MYRVIGLMSGTSLDGVDAALIETDGESVIEFGPGLEQAYSPKERTLLQAAVDAALKWKFDGDDPEEFEAADHVLIDAHAHHLDLEPDLLELARVRQSHGVGLHYPKRPVT